MIWIQITDLNTSLSYNELSWSNLMSKPYKGSWGMQKAPVEETITFIRIYIMPYKEQLNYNISYE